MVCFAYVFAALIQFTIVKTITTESDDEGRLKEEDAEFQTKHHSKAEEIAREWKSKVTRDSEPEKKSGGTSRHFSIPFADVPAASRLRRRVYDYHSESNYGDHASVGDYEGGVQGYSTEQIKQFVEKESPQEYRVGRTSRPKYYSDSETSYSSGLGSVTVKDSVFNSPDSSHFYYSPDIVIQKPWIFDEPTEHIYSKPVGGSVDTIYGKSDQPVYQIQIPSLYSQTAKSFGSRLSYLSPLAPDYIKRNLSMYSRSLSRSVGKSTTYSSGPSSFHSSKWYYEVGKLNQNQEANISNQTATSPLKKTKVVKKMSSFDDVQSDQIKSVQRSVDHWNTNLTWSAKRNMVRSSDVIKSVPSKKVMKKIEEKISRKELVGKIEKYSRILFPLTFLLFNLFYWPYIYNRA